ncbi:MAG: bifunctional hydroxymethylpyrimidine kinase/phosphomethylpyrimidine kinase [Acidobacteriota bacterium]
MRSIARALTIAGSDSAGCAGIQADLKTFAALGVHGMSVVTAVTAQNTRRILNSVHLPVEAVECQIEAVVRDIRVDAVKTGMLPSREIIEAVADLIGAHQLTPLVLDPVMVSSGGDPLIGPEAVGVLRRRLFPLATTVTPNRYEAEVLTQRELTDSRQVKEAARQIHAWGPASVIITGGHMEDGEESRDCFFDGRRFITLRANRRATPNTRGSGCTFASAIAAYLAQGAELEEAVDKAKSYVTEAIRASFPLGGGPGPLGHFFASWERPEKSAGSSSESNSRRSESSDSSG